MTGIHTTPADLAGQMGTHLAMAQWTIRFAQEPETYPVFLAWVRKIWPDCPYSDEEIGQDLVSAHNLMGQLDHLVRAAAAVT